jgi:hypothetical protein
MLAGKKNGTGSIKMQHSLGKLVSKLLTGGVQRLLPARTGD